MMFVLCVLTKIAVYSMQLMNVVSVSLCMRILECVKTEDFLFMLPPKMLAFRAFIIPVVFVEET